MDELDKIHPFYENQVIKENEITKGIMEREKQLSILYKKQGRATQFSSKANRWLQLSPYGFLAVWMTLQSTWFITTSAKVKKQKVSGAFADQSIEQLNDVSAVSGVNLRGIMRVLNVQVEAPKKKVKKTNLPVAELVYGGMFPADVQKAVEKEFEMALQDRVMEETKDRKNVVEAYVYDMRNKAVFFLSDKYQEFVTNSEREGFNTNFQEVGDWLYEDGEDETKGVYIAKLEELKKQGDPIEERYKESVNRGAVIDQLVHCVNSYREAAVSNDPRFDHIDISEKEKVWQNVSANGAGPNPEGSFHYGQINVTWTYVIKNVPPEIINGTLRTTLNGISFVNPDTPIRLADKYNVMEAYKLDFPDQPLNRTPRVDRSVINATYKGFIEAIKYFRTTPWCRVCM
nr:heat shock 70 kda protein 15 [Quercus suber]